jgi:hypothetical protein
MWLALALAAALFQVLRNTAMKRLGHALDEYINVWGRFTFLLPFALLVLRDRRVPHDQAGLRRLVRAVRSLPDAVDAGAVQGAEALGDLRWSRRCGR